jgi:Flp pilus assembly pilin Flp
MRDFAVRANVPLLAKRRRRFLLSEDGATAFEYALISALLSAFGFVVYRMLRDGLF